VITRWQRVLLGVLTALTCLLMVAPPAAAGPVAGKACKGVGRTVTVGEWTYTCTKKKGKAQSVWVRTRTPEPPAPPEPPRNDAEIGSLSFAPTRGAERPGDPMSTGLGPWATGLDIGQGSSLTAIGSADRIIDQAGVPNLLALDDGRLLAYFVSWAQGNVMAVGIREAGAWSFYRVAVEGLNISPGGANGVDPSAVLLPDGSIRLYWMQPTGRTGTSQIHSATSRPGSALGVRFINDPGTRFDPGRMVFDPTVALCAGRWFMWVNVDGQTTYTTSIDGLTFTSTTSPPGLAGAFPWSAYCMPDGKLQLLASTATGIGVPLLGDASGFTPAGPSLLPAGALADASLTRLRDGTWTLASLRRLA